MISTIKIIFLDKQYGKRDMGLPTPELKFEKDYPGKTQLSEQDVLEHVHHTKLAIQKLYTGSYCDFFRLVYRLGDNIVSEEYNSLKPVKNLVFKTEEESDKYNLSTKELKEKQKDDAAKAVVRDRMAKARGKLDDKSDAKPQTKQAKKSEEKSVKTKVKTKVEANPTETASVATFTVKSQFTGMGCAELKKKKLSLQSQMSRLKKAGADITEVQQYIKEINELMKVKKCE